MWCKYYYKDYKTNIRNIILIYIFQIFSNITLQN